MNLTMIIKTVGVLVLTLSLISCKQEVRDHSKAVVDESVKTRTNQEISASGSKLLYQYKKDDNEIILDFVLENDSAKGTLDYRLSGKDRNSGTINGVIKGDLLIADYVFMSEGITSTRQVVFKLVDNTLLEGYGDIVEQDGKVIFKDVNKLQYNPELKLELVSDSFAN